MNFDTVALFSTHSTRTYNSWIVVHPLYTIYNVSNLTDIVKMIVDDNLYNITVTYSFFSLSV